VSKVSERLDRMQVAKNCIRAGEKDPGGFEASAFFEQELGSFLLAEVERLRQTLRYYADKGNWDTFHAQTDGGQKAREALSAHQREGE
jgi:hypothetical protein